jgi:hypothetical protein
MTIETRLIFGLRIDAPTELAITADLQGAAAPGLVIRRRVGDEKFSDDAPIAHRRGRWAVSLDEGDYVIHLDGWFGEPCEVALDPPGSFVVQGKIGSPMTWQAKTVQISDPKDPWPPPAAGAVKTGDTWFSKVLPALRSQIVNPKGLAGF